VAVIRDVMPAFELLQPSSIADAQKLLQRHGADAWIMAGGLDSFDWLKDRIKKPKVLVDLSGIEELQGVRATRDGIEIGAMTTLTAAAVLASFTHYFGFLVAAAAFTTCFLMTGRRRKAIVAFAGCSILALFAPWVVYHSWFVDTRLAGGATQPSVQAGGAVEFFASQRDAERRFTQLMAAQKGSAQPEQLFHDGAVVLRLSHDLKADQVSEYEISARLALAGR